jgi:hypothetical protein
MMIEGLGLGREGFRLEQGDAWHGVREGGEDSIMNQDIWT